ncbi:MAG TPA: heat-inducible transcriptional repressor HrcA [Acidimicrobiales bacterium]|nr:heat-inducible transcriptional repressor HrcA [Acidimicrobiales bacterium]
MAGINLDVGSNLDDRKAAILRAVVTEYVETAQPVGSQRVAQAPDVGVSSATVRNDMSALEREGYLVQPHTSAGRIPTDKGYRFFVDSLAAPGRLDPSQRHRVSQFFTRAHGELEQMLEDTSKLLSTLTDYAAVVVGPSHEAGRIRSVQLVGLTDRLALLVVVLSDGAVEKRSIEVGEDTGEARLAAATAHLTAHLVGRPLQDVGPSAHGPVAPPATGDARTDVVVGDAVSALATLGGDRNEEAEQVYVRGASRMADAFDAVQTVRSVLSILEQQYVVVTLLRDVLDRGLSVAIGAELGVATLAECSVVVAPFDTEGEPAGTIGVLGPTRMNYPQALTAVAVVSQRLGRHLREA